MIDLATIKRKKVSTKATQGQKKTGLLRNKKFWIISCIVFIILVAAGITTGVLVARYYNKDTEKEKVDYLAKEYSYQDTTITFTKMNYEGIVMHLYPNDFNDGTYQKHIFFFAYDESTFYPDKAIDNGKDSDDETLYNNTHDNALQELIKVQFAINKWNKKILSDGDDSNNDEVAYLYVVDISVANNNSALTSSQFVPSDATSGTTFAFGYIAGEDGPKLEFEFKNEDDKETLYTQDMNTFVTTVSANVRDFIESEFKLEVED